MSQLAGFSLSIVSAAAGSSKPFTVGQAFKQGDVPAGSTVQCASVTGFQCVIKNSWNDGSAKFAILSGLANLTANTPLSLPLDTTAASALTGMTTAQLKATGIVASVGAPDGKDWTFSPAAHTVGELVAMTHLQDVIVSGLVTVNNGATAGASTAVNSGTNAKITATISGGTEGGLQTSRATVIYRHGRNITAITKAANAKITFDQPMTVQVGDTVNLSTIGGMVEMNGLSPTVVTVDPGLTWVTVNVDSTAFTTFTSGGVGVSSRTNTNYKESAAYVRTGGGIEWNGTTGNTYAADNVGLFSAGVTWSGTDWDSPLSTWVSGPTMTSWMYRKQMGTDPHVVAWLEVRLYSNGNVEVLPWVENGYLNVARPTSKLATYSFTLGGTQRYSGLFELGGHQRTVLIGDGSLSYWLGTDPTIIPKHSSSYLQATELVPSYSGNSPSNNIQVSALPSTYVPLTKGSFLYDGGSASMSASGYQPAIGLLPQHDVLYLTHAAANLYPQVIRNGFYAGQFGIHYRDETTNRPPLFSAYPTLTLGFNSSVKDTGSSSTGTRTPTKAGLLAAYWDTAHCPSVGYMAYLLTGLYYFMEEVQFAAITIHFNTADQSRGGQVFGPSGWANVLSGPYTGASSIATTDVQTRSSAWHFRNLTQALTVTPDNDSNLRNEFKTAVEHNCAWHYGVYSQTPSNPYGFVQSRWTDVNFGNARGLPAWQQDFVTAAWGYARAMALPISATAQTQMANFHEWKSKSIVGRLGQNNGTDWWYVNAAPYAVACTTTIVNNFFPAFGATGPWFPSWRAMYDASFTPPFTWMSSTEGQLASEFYPETQPGQFHNMFPALAYAVRFGVPGSTAAYNRVVNSTNYPAVAAVMDTRPVWSVKPASFGAETVPTTPTYTGSALRIRKPADFASGVHVGSLGFGVLGSVIRSATVTGDSGAGALFDMLDNSATDDNYELSLVVTTPPNSGQLFVYNDGSYSHTGAADGSWPWQAQVMKQGVAVGSPVTVTDTFGSAGTTPFSASIVRGTTAVAGSFSSFVPGTLSGSVTRGITAVAGAFSLITPANFTGALTRDVTAVGGALDIAPGGTFTMALTRQAMSVAGSFVGDLTTTNFSMTVIREATGVTGTFSTNAPSGNFSGAVARGATAVGGGGFQSVDDLTRYINTAKSGLSNLIALINANNAKAGISTNYTASMFKVCLIKASSTDEWNTKVTLEALASSGFPGLYDTLYNRLALNQTLVNLPSRNYTTVFGETKSQVLSRILANFGIVASEVDSNWVDQGPWNTAAMHTLTITPLNGDLNLLYLPGSSLVINVTTPGPF